MLVLAASQPKSPSGADCCRFRCLMAQGVRIALLEARKAYEACGAPSALRLFVDPGVGHEATPAMWWQVDAFLQETLLPPAE